MGSFVSAFFCLFIGIAHGISFKRAVVWGGQMSGTAAMELAEGQLYNKSKWIKPLMPLEKRRFVCPAACEAKQFVRCTCKKDWT